MKQFQELTNDEVAAMLVAIDQKEVAKQIRRHEYLILKSDYFVDETDGNKIAANEELILETIQQIESIEDEFFKNAVLARYEALSNERGHKKIAPMFEHFAKDLEFNS